jgi:hypothetical protein
MRSFSSTLLAAYLLVGVSPAQEPSTTRSPSSRAEALETTSKQKPYYVSPDNMLLRCKSQEFLECMEMKESQCISFITKGFAEGNALVEADAASKPSKDTSSDTFRTSAIAAIAEHLHRVSKGKSTACI